MNLTFIYSPEKETEVLRVALDGKHSNQPTAFGLAAREAGIDIRLEADVVRFVSDMIHKEQIDTADFAEQFATAWSPFQEKAVEVFKQSFDTDWDPGNVTAYLTLGQRCPYNPRENYFFVSMTTQPLAPVATTLHELQHFYAHAVLQPLFNNANLSQKFDDFKEAITVLLNLQFSMALEAPDKGYAKHKELREWILDETTKGNSLAHLTQTYLDSLS